MDQIVINDSSHLKGQVKIEGSKNAVLPILAATILASNDQSVITNVPLLSDFYIMKSVLESLNLKTQLNESKNEIVVDATGELTHEAPFELVTKMRASIVVMGPLVARTGYAKISLPGGCAIGERPIDLHLKGLEKLGVKIEDHGDFIEAFAKNGLIGNNINLDFPSVGATQNILMAATLADGITVISNAAKEPEIIDLINFLNKMGAKIIGKGTSTLTITGVSSLLGVTHNVVQDRIEAGTFMVAGAIGNNDIKILDAIKEHNEPLIDVLIKMGASVSFEEDGIRVKGNYELKSINVETEPYPGFPTDMQSQVTVLQALSDGQSQMKENVFENRFMHMQELNKMGVNFRQEGNTIKINGSTHLKGAEVDATDLRAAASLIIAGLNASGKTVVNNLKYLDRGYFKFHKKLSDLGANIQRISK
ncbi:UDP-N-acetylglucosamine 1-carboxyvinyltransferase [Lactobacillus sp. S2-2]|uniref:UDP-N-acetylglucosamine 1-carboxyvinyltransferase n=1 Tax=Lactobacillus sp. S2-2 TaxID=2692917 RepID=UPI001F003A45|nr:UDP-N-acetylglucosamine 1-carboxyvinyltransferase [Lactobacillus sp. S2-2]MCF6515773.1 UDP-N-acetylglucosamine 1-carboxyvinyltransferase [Lactobacillus sp. S2-2]